LEPDTHGDWLKQRNADFDTFIALGDKSGSDSAALFENYSRGLETNRDAWVFNFSRESAAENIRCMIDFYNGEVDRFHAAHGLSDRKTREAAIDGFISNDSSKISWNRSLKNELVKGTKFTFDAECLTPSIYRPFTRNWVYYHRQLNAYVNQLPRIFPMRAKKQENRVICVSAPGNISNFTALMTAQIPELCLSAMKGGTQIFPRFIYDEQSDYTKDAQQGDLLSAVHPPESGRPFRDALTDAGLEYFHKHYPGESITKDDIFYYVYGLLHSEDYRGDYSDNLSKQLPRIPVVKTAAAFWAFVDAGRRLADLHCDYDIVEPFPVQIVQGDLRLADTSDPQRFYRVEQMRFAGKRPNLDKTTVVYNANITLTGIPLEAYDYVVNGKSALEWVMERQVVKTDKDSGIVNDANRYAIETVGDPAYPLKLFQRVITVSLETMKLVRSLPPLDIMGPEAAAKDNRPLEPAQ
jgi:predicted helicase